MVNYIQTSNICKYSIAMSEYVSKVHEFYFFQNGLFIFKYVPHNL